MRNDEQELAQVCILEEFRVFVSALIEILLTVLLTDN